MSAIIAPFDKTKDPNLSRRGFGLLTLGVGAAAAGGAMAADGVVEIDITIKTADGVCDAALFHPEGKGPWPGAIIFTDILGLRPAFRTMARRLAAEGYTVLVPNPFYRTKKAPVIEGPFDFAKDRAKLGPLTAPLTDAARDTDVHAYIAYMGTLKSVKQKARIGVSGYCMGGPYTFMAASARPDRVGAVGSFHGGGLVTDKPDSPHLMVAKMKVEAYLGIANNDDQHQPDAKDKLRDAFAAAGLPARIEVYTDCQHGWCVPDGTVYNQGEAERAMADLVNLYRKTLV